MAMHLQRNNVAPLRNHLCHENVTICSLCIVVDLPVAVKNIKLLRVAKELEQWVLFALLPNYKMLRTAVNNINLHVKCPLFLSDFNQIWIFSTDFHRSVQHQISRKSI
jgi:hypothetical protein